MTEKRDEWMGNLAASQLGLHRHDLVAVVEPSYEDTTTVVVLGPGDEGRFYLCERRKAWHIGFGTLAELVREVAEVRGRIVRRWREPGNQNPPTRA